FRCAQICDQRIEMARQGPCNPDD
ncbi:unnamed protein product, partial [Allacma fusca]